MTWRSEWKALLFLGGGYAVAYWMPLDRLPDLGLLAEPMRLLHWYARHHVMLCLIPALILAGAMATFVQQGTILKYLGQKSRPATAYGVASVAGSVLAVCSCTILPLFAGIYRLGAGLGPATAFLYAGPAVNVLAIILTARILGPELGIARAAGAVAFSVVIGLMMHLLFRADDTGKAAQAVPEDTADPGSGRVQLVLFASLIGTLVFANWGQPDGVTGLWSAVYGAKWYLTGLCAALMTWAAGRLLAIRTAMIIGVGATVLALALLPATSIDLIFALGTAALATLAIRSGKQGQEWMSQSWRLTKQILPLLAAGIVIAGLLMGSTEGSGLVPAEWIATAVGGESWIANLLASVAAAMMYFATLTEVPILQGLLANGMGDGPALALLLAGPAVSLPNLLVIRSILGNKRTMAYLGLVIIMATISGWLFGNLI